MVGIFTNHPLNPYHCGAGYTAPSWRFGGMASRVWADAPDADVDRLAADLGRFAGPVLLLAGACNTWTGATLQEQHQALFHNADLSIIESAGHDVIWDNPDVSLSTIRAFLGAGREE